MSANATLAEMAFYRTERPILIAQSIVDYDQQCTLLKRRWEAIRKPGAAAAPAAAPVNEVPFLTPLTASEMQGLNLVLRRIDAADPANIQFMYVWVQDVDPEPVVTATPPALCGKRKAVSACPTAPDAKRAAGPNLFNKLMAHLKKDNLQNICEDLGVPVSGNKDELISRIAETLR